MRVLERRLRKLEVGLLPPAVTEASRDLANSTCRRTLWPNGTVCENVVLATGNNGGELTQEQLDKWVASFPVETL